MKLYWFALLAVFLVSCSQETEYTPKVEIDDNVGDFPLESCPQHCRIVCGESNSLEDEKGNTVAVTGACLNPYCKCP